MLRVLIGIAVGLLALIESAPGFAAGPCADQTFSAQTYTVCRFDPRRADLRLFWRDSAGAPLATFDNVQATLSNGEQLVFAMNAGMYDQNNAPVGLYVEDGVELKRANLRSGAGNFHLKPNGVFWIGGGQAGVMETTRYLAQKPKADYATQSGPMLVIGGKVHPRIHETGVSMKIRNGVGQARDGAIIFAISNQPVTFFEFASLFRDALACDNALFLDGSISALYAPGLHRQDFALPMGPIVGAVEKVK